MGVFAHGFTYSGHPVACAVALEAVKMYQEMDIPSVVQDIEPMFQVLWPPLLPLQLLPPHVRSFITLIACQWRYGSAQEARRSCFKA